MTKGRVTLRHIAHELDIDPSSVSMALRGHPRISPQTRQRVLEAARRLGYRVNAAAQQLATGRSSFLGLALPASFATLRAEAALRTIERLASLVAADDQAFTIMPASDFARAARDPLVPLLPEGLFIWGDVPLNDLSDRFVGDIPTVVLDPNHASYAGYRKPHVSVDNVGVGRLMVRHLIERGVQRLLFVQGVTQHLGHLQRWEGARQAWLEARPQRDLTFTVIHEVQDDLLRDLAVSHEGAVLCVTDSMAVSLLHRLLRLGCCVPRDVRVAGINGDAPARVMDVTTAGFDSVGLAEAGYRVMRALLQHVPLPKAPPLEFIFAPGETT